MLICLFKTKPFLSISSINLAYLHVNNSDKHKTYTINVPASIREVPKEREERQIPENPDITLISGSL